MCEDTHMQINDTLVSEKNNYNFAIATLANSTLAILARLTNPTNKKQLNNEPRLEPVCWQCGAERGLLTLHTGSGELFVCHSCAGGSL